MKKRIIRILLAAALLIGCGMGILTQKEAEQQGEAEGTETAEEQQGPTLEQADGDTGSGEMEFLNDFWKSLLIGKRELVVGKSLDPAKITEFWYTYDSSTDPPAWQRYRFFTEDGTRWFYRETRAGDHWPLTEADISEQETLELSEEEWEQFLSFTEGGVVRKREDAGEDGDAGPWLFLYWDGDQSMYQAFTFADPEGLPGFEEFCRTLRKK